jgi:hypothetical protein
MARAESCPCCQPCVCARSDDRARDVHLDPSLHPYREQGRESDEVDQKRDAVMCLEQGVCNTASQCPAVMFVLASMARESACGIRNLGEAVTYSCSFTCEITSYKWLLMPSKLPGQASLIRADHHSPLNIHRQHGSASYCAVASGCYQCHTDLCQPTWPCASPRLFAD